MFQTYDDPPGAAESAPHLAALRDELSRLNLDGFVLPRADEHLGEELPASAERLAWLTGFTGSAGTIAVLADKAAIFVDGRYTLQVREQVDLDQVDPLSISEITPSKWLGENAEKGQRIGYDPWLMSRKQAQSLRKSLDEAGIELIAVDSNPIDRLWNGRPASPHSPAFLQGIELAGRSRAEKVSEIQEIVSKADADAIVLTDSTAIAWLFNIRGNDVPHTPIVQAFAIVPDTGQPVIFLNSRELPENIRSELEKDCVIAEKLDFSPILGRLGESGKTVIIDPSGSPDAVSATVEDAGGTVIEDKDPVSLPRARKTGAELAGARAAHVRDGAAMVQFLSWLSRAGDQSVTEIDAAKQLEQCRVEAGSEDEQPLVDISFDTISATGPNGALPHYRVTEGTNRTLARGDLIVVDSGGQYRDGTTDITRTVLVGGPDDDIDIKRDRFTRVLKGHIAIATARFPKGTDGTQLDTLARQFLWREGLDFDHGTGHGVGSFLSVHEGPQRLSKSGTIPFEPGMIVSNEPGYYWEGHFGIRIENLVYVREAAIPLGGDRPVLSFADLTLAPIDRRLIATGLMTIDELAWLNLYHQRVYASLSGWPSFTEEDRDFLESACRPIIP